jgi:hypothetical protein
MKVYVYQDMGVVFFRDKEINGYTYMGECDLPIIPPRKTVTKETSGVRYNANVYQILCSDGIPNNAKNIKVTYAVEE